MEEIAELWQYYASVSLSDPKLILENLFDERIDAIYRKVSDMYSRVMK
jgi:hypothetical protein